MREARLVGLSQDGKQLILAMAETGEEFAIPVDDRLRAALRGDRARLGQLEIQMESALRPRDIQARIRAGESPEAVAAVAQMPMERVMAFAGPVLAERDHVASLAQRASVRRRGGGDAPTRNLGAWVTERLRIRGVDPAAADWDAWRREDGRWAVRVSYHVAEDDEKIAMFAYDAPGRYAVPDDDEARWLVGEQAQVLPPQQPERRLTAVADIDLALAPDHGADSYEAGFEDTLNLTRARQTPRETFNREPATNRESRETYGRESAAGRDDRESFGRERAGREEVPSRDADRETARGRDFGRDDDRGPRRVHSVPSPDEEPTLIDVPIEPPSPVRPAVRAVERPTQLPAEAASIVPPEERAAAPDNPFTEHRISPAARTPEQRSPAEPRQGTPPVDPRPDLKTPPPKSADPRRPDPQPPTPRPADPRDADRRTDAPAEPAAQLPVDAPAPVAAAVVDNPAAETPAPEAPATEAEPKKKPARRGSKRASVPSWDEIMFGKKAD
ncbi:DUF3071 family protein [Kribbella sp. VKM Ac-2527]|uniref:DUF3071 family protein n=1 Tax=Kribbella caucasensis TaxID=2512215 RepID=A0A4R6K634_9ACTN|nr:septation protein SepH [Kribbella sp. VKM Ac-2527]TDO44377.1 DUF3071 family protein [Kribbella sp. VKM Ac-2527]